MNYNDILKIFKENNLDRRLTMVDIAQCVMASLLFSEYTDEEFETICACVERVQSGNMHTQLLADIVCDLYFDFGWDYNQENRDDLKNAIKEQDLSTLDYICDIYSNKLRDYEF